jgi:AbiV family abortive infection protein
VLPPKFGEGRGVNNKNVREEPLKSIIRNCHRLIRDAEILLEKGSAGSALSLAILAFEEAGKGHSHELNARHHPGKTKIKSSHHFRHLMSAMVLMASLHQKYGLEFAKLADEQREKIKERLNSAPSFAEFASTPAPEEIRQIIGTHLLSKFESLPNDQRTIALVEFNWLRKVTKASAVGDVEKLRQKGFYVDFNNQGLLTRPSEVTRREAYTWIWTAKRAVNLLAFGVYYQPYSELAALLEGMPKPLPDVQHIKSMIDDQLSSHEPPEDNEVDIDMGPYPPFGAVSG